MALSGLLYQETKLWCKSKTTQPESQGEKNRSEPNPMTVLHLCFSYQWMCCIPVLVYYMVILHMQGNDNCNQDATEYGNVHQACLGAVCEHTSIASHRKCGGLFIKEEQCNNNIFKRIWNYENCIYSVHK